MFPSLSSRQKQTALKLSSIMISNELRAIRESVQRLVFDIVRENSGYKGEELQLALGYRVFFEWVMIALDESSSPDHLFQPSDSLRVHSLRIIEHISTSRKLVGEIKDTWPTFDPKVEFALGLSKSNDPRWVTSLSRGVVISARMMGFSFCKRNHVQTMLPPVSEEFGALFVSLCPQVQMNALVEWLDAVLGEASKELL